jgi:ribosomal protein S18 acetylase RimI-like enzyme
MLAHVIEHARQTAAARVEVGTGNSSLHQLRFYQRNGFRVTGIVADFFRDDEPPIMEEGIRCLDLIRLACPVPPSAF